MDESRVVGLVLAAGEGRRFGRPKATVRDSDGQTWLARSVVTLREGGVDEVYAVVGASAAGVRLEAPPRTHVVEADGWREGMGASLRAGLGAVLVEQSQADAVIVMLVDTPGVGAAVVRRMLQGVAPQVLRRAAYDGAPGHPVVIGREHWQGVVDSARDDEGARVYLRLHAHDQVECGHLGTGSDIDTSDALAAWQRGAATEPQRPDFST